MPHLPRQSRETEELNGELSLLRKHRRAPPLPPEVPLPVHATRRATQTCSPQLHLLANGFEAESKEKIKARGTQTLLQGGQRQTVVLFCRLSGNVRENAQQSVQTRSPGSRTPQRPPACRRGCPNENAQPHFDIHCLGIDGLNYSGKSQNSEIPTVPSYIRRSIQHQWLHDSCFFLL